MSGLPYTEKVRLIWIVRLFMGIGALVSLGAVWFALHLYDIGMMYLGVLMTVTGVFGIVVSAVGYVGIVSKLRMM